METNQDDNPKDDGGEKDLADVVVEYLLVGVGGVAGDGFAVRCFSEGNGVGCD